MAIGMASRMVGGVGYGLSVAFNNSWMQQAATLTSVGQTGNIAKFAKCFFFLRGNETMTQGMKEVKESCDFISLPGLLSQVGKLYNLEWTKEVNVGGEQGETTQEWVPKKQLAANVFKIASTLSLAYIGVRSAINYGLQRGLIDSLGIKTGGKNCVLFFKNETFIQKTLMFSYGASALSQICTMWNTLYPGRNSFPEGMVEGQEKKPRSLLNDSLNVIKAAGDAATFGLALKSMSAETINKTSLFATGMGLLAAWRAAAPSAAK